MFFFGLSIGLQDINCVCPTLFTLFQPVNRSEIMEMHLCMEEGMEELFSESCF